MSLHDSMSAVPKFGIGQSPSRKEDRRLLSGGGRYTGDVREAGELTGLFLRSPYPHARLLGIDAGEARAMEGVAAVYTQADLDAAGYNDLGCGVPLKDEDGSDMIVPPHPSLARDRLRYVGQPMALVVAADAAIARTALEALAVEVEALEPVTGMEDALADGAPQLHDEVPGNRPVTWSWGDHAAVDAAMASAAHVTRLRLVHNRVHVTPMEPRGAIAAFADGRWTVRTGCQGAFGLRAQLAAAIGCEVERIRVLAEDIGGSFGMKASIFPEHVPLLHAARELGRPVRWINDRSESFLADYHGRDSVYDAALALDTDGNILAVKLDGIGAVGAYVAGFGPAIPTMVIQKNLASLYRTPVYAMRVRLAMTSTTPTTAYRGAGRPEAIYMMERLIEAAAHETGRDPIALRRRNMIRPDELPFSAASGLTYDSGEFEALLDQALGEADHAGFAARRARSEARGRLRGLGLCTYLEVTAPPGKEMGGIRFKVNGGVTIVTGTLDYGQGHASAFAQVLADKLGVPFDSIDLLQGDSDELIAGGGTGGSRSLMASGEAIDIAGDKVIEQGRNLAAERLEAAEADIVFEDGQYRIAGTDRTVALLDLVKFDPVAMSANLVIDTPPSAFPNGAHIAEVEIDPDTGKVTLERYIAVDDFGTMVNPMLVDGQVHGGLVQAIGQILGEDAAYDANGQLVAGSFMDYYVPRAGDLPGFELSYRPVPARTNSLGAKGCGEAGITAGLPTVMNAILDALSPLGILDLDMPATPEKIWRVIRDARASR
ncbi:MAG: xanthine dehydrogenase family protein molybdopterin-binding subunit [Geminicoccaceae bacterium]|nr:xanthine dehydrogenase family protein molybdopterin-binding subunit [Geminicoccaceae bacterium]